MGLIVAAMPGTTTITPEIIGTVTAIGSCLFAGAHVHRLWVVTQREALAEPGLEVRAGVQQAPAALDQGVRREGGYAAETPWRETH